MSGLLRSAQSAKAPLCPKCAMRSFFLVEALALLLALSITLGGACRLNISQIQQQRAQLDQLELRHIVPLLWYQLLQPQALRATGIDLENFDEVEALELPKWEVKIKGSQRVACIAHLRFSRLARAPKRTITARKQLILARLQLKLGAESYTSCRYLILQRALR